MDQQVKRYYQLKQKQKEIDQQLAELRSEIMGYCEERGAAELEIGSYSVKIVLQERKEYNGDQLYAALPDPEVWRLMSKPDSAKIASLVKLHVIPEEKIQDTYTVKQVSLLYVDKK